MDTRREQLEALLTHLNELVAILTLDPLCRWRKHFAACQQRAAELLRSGFTQNALNELSGSVNHVFRGSGSFNDYAPVTTLHDGTFKRIAGMKSVTELAGKVYETALSLRVVGHAS